MGANIEPTKAALATGKVIPNPKARLLAQVREVIRVKHYSIRTEQAYVGWIKRFIFFHGKRMEQPTFTRAIGNSRGDRSVP